MDAKIKLVHSVKSRFFILAEYFEDKDFTRENYNVFLSELLNSGRKQSYANMFTKLVKHLDRFLRYKNATYQLQFTDYKLFKEKKGMENIDTLSWEEMDAISRSTPTQDPFTNIKYQVLVALFNQTGCRVNEACNLLKVDVLTDRICFRDTKNSEDRWVYITEELRDSLLTVATGKYIFSNDGTAPLNDRVVNRYVGIMAKKVGITKRVYSHLFRHSFVTNLIIAGTPPTIVSKIVGHKDPAVTYRYYSHLHLNEMRNALTTFHPMLKKQVSFESIRDRAKELMDQLIDTNRFSYEWVEDGKSFKIVCNVKETDFFGDLDR